MVEMLKQSKRDTPEQLERTKANLDRRRADVTGLAATAQDVFMAVPTPNEFTYRVYRFDQALQNPTLVVEKLRGCCAQMDIQARDGTLLVQENLPGVEYSLDTLARLITRRTEPHVKLH